MTKKQRIGEDFLKYLFIAEFIHGFKSAL